MVFGAAASIRGTALCSSTSSRPSAAGCVERLRWRRLADQQRQRRHEGLPGQILETKVPLRVRRYSIRPDSGGAGQWRGGNGVVRRIRASLRRDDDLPLVGTLRSRRLGHLRRTGRRAARSRDQPRPRRRTPTVQERRHHAQARRHRPRLHRRRRRYGDPAKRDRTAIEEDIANGDRPSRPLEDSTATKEKRDEDSRSDPR